MFDQQHFSNLWKWSINSKKQQKVLMLKNWRGNEWRESMRTICRSRSRAKQYESQHELEAKLRKSGRHTKVGSEQPQWVLWGGGGLKWQYFTSITVQFIIFKLFFGRDTKERVCLLIWQRQRAEIASNSVALPPSWSHTVKLCTVQRWFDTNRATISEELIHHRGWTTSFNRGQC